MRATENVEFNDIAATTSGFVLVGGRYMFTAVATWGGGSVGLEILAGDGTTYLTVITALTTNGGATVDLPPGQYRVSVATATAVYATLTRVPLE